MIANNTGQIMKSNKSLYSQSNHVQECGCKVVRGLPQQLWCSHGPFGV